MPKTSESQRALIDPATELDAALEQRHTVKTVVDLERYAEVLDGIREDLVKIAEQAKAERSDAIVAALRINRQQFEHLFYRIELSPPFPSAAAEAALYDFQARIGKVCRCICLLLDKRNASAPA